MVNGSYLIGNMTARGNTLVFLLEKRVLLLILAIGVVVIISLVLMPTKSQAIKMYLLEYIYMLMIKMLPQKLLTLR